MSAKKMHAIPYAQFSTEMRSGKIIKIDDGFTKLLGYTEADVKTVSYTHLDVYKRQIPYYVGPMNTKNRNERFSWACRKEGKQEEKIYPWNWKDIIDEDKTAARFIERMRNTCTYLPGEDVLPRYSLLYSEFVMLNELNKIKAVSYTHLDEQMRELFTMGFHDKNL